MGWFVKFWIVSSLISLIVLWVTAFSIDAEVKREYDIIGKQKTTIAEYIRSSFACLIPLVNVFMTIYIVFGYKAILAGTISRLELCGKIKEKA